MHLALTGDAVAGMGGIPEGPGPYDGLISEYLGEKIIRPQLSDEFLINATDEQLRNVAIYLGVKNGIIIYFGITRGAMGAGFWGSVGTGAFIGGADYVANASMMNIISDGRTPGPTWAGFYSATAWGGAGGAVGHAASPFISKAGSWLGKVTSPVTSAVAKVTNAAKNRVAGWFGRGGSAAPNSGIRFAQKGISSMFRHGEFAGKTIDEVAAGLRSGAINPSQLPIQTITRDGVRYTINNRSLMALRKAGLEPTVVRDVTGNSFFEKQLTERLKEIGEIADNFVPHIRGGGG